MAGREALSALTQAFGYDALGLIFCCCATRLGEDGMTNPAVIIDEICSHISHATVDDLWRHIPNINRLARHYEPVQSEAILTCGRQRMTVTKSYDFREIF